MSISDPLFKGNRILLGAINHEIDPPVESGWTHHGDYLGMVSPNFAMPQSPSQVKKRYEEIEKSQEDRENSFYFHVRLLEDNRLIGFAEISWIEWSNAAGFVRLGIGSPNERRQGYGSEILELLLRFTFTELNLFRLTARIAGYNLPAIGLFQKFGFVEEVRSREALQRFGKRWDLLHLGLLADEWTGSKSVPNNAAALAAM